MPLVEHRGGFRRVVLGDQVVGGRGRIGERHVDLAGEEQPVGLGPAGRDGDDVVGEARPDLGRAVAVSRLDPHQQAQTGRGAARIVDDDGRVGGRQLLEIRRHVGEILAVHEGEIAPIVGQEDRIGPFDGEGQVRRLDAVRLEEAGVRRLRREVGVEAEHDVGGAARALQTQPREERRAVARADETHVAIADRLEVLGDGGTGAPFADEALVGVDDELGPVLRAREKRCEKQGRRGQKKGSHRSLHSTATEERWMRGGCRRASRLPSAGMIRFRFDGSRGCASQPGSVPDPPRQMEP